MVAVTALTMLGACSTRPSSAEATLEAYAEHVHSDEPEAACSLLAFEGTPVAEDERLMEECLSAYSRMVAGGIPLASGQAFDHDVRVQGDRAAVAPDDDPETWDPELVRIDGTWYVVFPT